MTGALLSTSLGFLLTFYSLQLFRPNSFKWVLLILTTSILLSGAIGVFFNLLLEFILT